MQAASHAVTEQVLDDPQAFAASARIDGAANGTKLLAGSRRSSRVLLR